MDLRTLGLNMTCIIYPVNSVIDMSHIVDINMSHIVDINNPELVKKMHNRSTANVRLRDFSDTNLRNYHAAGDALVAVAASSSRLQLGRYLNEFEGVQVGFSPQPPKWFLHPYIYQECVKAYFNYSAICRHLHTLDWSGMTLLEILTLWNTHIHSTGHLDQGSLGQPSRTS